MPALKRFLPLVLVVILGLFAFIPAAQAAPEIKDILKQIEPAVGIVWVYDQKGEVRGHGSGFFLTADGEFITNRHVLEGAYSAYIEMANGKKHRVNKVLASNPQLDMVKVLVETRGESMPFLKTSASLPEKGDRVLVYGNPIQFNFVLAEGIVSAIQQVQKSGGDTWIQFTAPVSQGNSGGPLINMNAEVVGIVTWGSREGQNLNFALPMYELRNLIDYAASPDYAPPGSDAPIIPPKGAVQREKPAIPVVFVSPCGNGWLWEYKPSNDFIHQKLYAKIDLKRYSLRTFQEVRPQLLKYFDGYINPQQAIDLTAAPKELLSDFGRKTGLDYILAISISVNFSGYYKREQRADVRAVVKLFDVNQGEYLYYDALDGSGRNFDIFFTTDRGNAERAAMKALEIVFARFDKEVKLP